MDLLGLIARLRQLDQQARLLDGRLCFPRGISFDMIVGLLSATWSLICSRSRADVAGIRGNLIERGLSCATPSIQRERGSDLPSLALCGFVDQRSALPRCTDAPAALISCFASPRCRRAELEGVPSRLRCSATCRLANPLPGRLQPGELQLVGPHDSAPSIGNSSSVSSFLRRARPRAAEILAVPASSPP